MREARAVCALLAAARGSCKGQARGLPTDQGESSYLHILSLTYFFSSIFSTFLNHPSHSLVNLQLPSAFTISLSSLPVPWHPILTFLPPSQLHHSLHAAIRLHLSQASSRLCKHVLFSYQRQDFTPYSPFFCRRAVMFRRHWDSALRSVPELLVSPEGVGRLDSTSPKVLPTERLHLAEAELRLPAEQAASARLEERRGYSCSGSCCGNNKSLRKEVQRF